MKSDSLKQFNQTQAGVFHTTHWGQSIPEDFVKDLVREAEQNPNRKARLCLHPSPEDITQVTFIALVAPYRDQFHKHPNKPEIMIPILGKAELTIINAESATKKNYILDSESVVPASIESNLIHSLRVISTCFVFLEIGNGPFTTESTLYV